MSHPAAMIGRMRGDVDRAIAELARSQFGSFSRSQAARAGCSRSMIAWRIETGRWEVLHPSVFAIAGSVRSWHRSLIAACLLGGPDTVVARRAAAKLWNLRSAVATPVEVLSDRWRRVQAQGIRAHESLQIDDVDRARVQGIPVTSVERTLIDCGADLHPHRVGEMLDDARRRGLVSLGDLGRRVDALGASGRDGIGVMRRLLIERDAPPASVFERRLKRVLDAAGLPHPATSWKVQVGTESFELDFAYPDLRLGIEADSAAFHLDLAAFHRDRHKQNALVLAGWTMLRFTWRDLSSRPGLLTDQVRRGLAVAA